jgi:glutamyl-Q tRNA(Asp) synthetase
MHYIGRFAPSPTGALHAGSLVAALASWLDAQAHGGQWLVRIEDVDAPRCVPGADLEILRQLAACGLMPDAQPVYQSQRSPLYQAALDQLIAQQAAYPCACSRKDIADAQSALGWVKPRHGELIYPGTCRSGLHGRLARAWRFHTDFYQQNRPSPPTSIQYLAIKKVANQDTTVHWQDRRLGAQRQDVVQEVGDFVLRRSDGLWAYQLAVVTDDAAQGITHIVRGEDLADNTARQILLQRTLGYATPTYLHTPLVLAPDGQKLSKQNGAQPLTMHSSCQALQALQQAARHLGLLSTQSSDLGSLLSHYTLQWKAQQLSYNAVQHAN